MRQSSGPFKPDGIPSIQCGDSDILPGIHNTYTALLKAEISIHKLRYFGVWGEGGGLFGCSCTIAKFQASFTRKLSSQRSSNELFIARDSMSLKFSKIALALPVSLYWCKTFF